MRTPRFFLFFFFNDTATTEIYTLSLHDALPISRRADVSLGGGKGKGERGMNDPIRVGVIGAGAIAQIAHLRSEEHTSELQSRLHLVCRLLLEKKKKKKLKNTHGRIDNSRYPADE